MTNLRSEGGIIAWFAANPVAANLLMLLVIVAGLLSSGQLRREAFPATDPESLTISVTYLSGSAKQSEEGIAIKIEEALEGVTGIKHITSTANSRGVTITIERQNEYDLNTLLRDVKNKVDGISNFPAQAEKPVIEKAEREAHALTLQLYGNTERYALQQLAESLKAELLSQNDINQVNYAGWIDPMLSIEIDDNQLQAYGLTLTDVQNAVNNTSSNTNTAILRNTRLFLQLKASEQAYYARDFATIPLITSAEHGIVALGDIASISDTFDDSTPVLSRYNGNPSVGLEIISTGDDDILRTVAAAKKVVQQWHDDNKLPVGVELISWDDDSEKVSSRLNLLIKNAIMGIALVFLLLALFLNIKVAFWVAMGLPFIFFGTLFFMGKNFADLSLNMFTTFGFIMALGIVVDDAVVVGESIYSHRKKHGDTLNNTIRGTMAVAVPTLFGVFTTVAAFAALSQVSGRLGTLYSQFAVVVTICLLLSVVESKLILPSHLSHLHTHRSNQHRNFLQRIWATLQHAADNLIVWITDKLYIPTITQAIRHRHTVLVIGLSLLLLVLAMPFNGTVRISFFPDVPGDTVTANLTMQKDASYGLTHNALQFLEEKAYAVNASLGGDNATISHLQLLSEADQSGSISVEFKPESPYTPAQFAREWRQLSGIPEGTKTLSIQSSRRSVDALRIELRADNDDTLNRAGNELREHLQSIAAISGIDDNLTPTQPQLNIELTEQGQSMGLSTDELASQIYQAFSGQVVQRYQRGADEIEVKVRFPASDRGSAADVLNAKIRSPSGAVVPVSSVATVTAGFTRDSITRIDGQRAVYISADVDKQAQSVTELVSTLKATISEELELHYPDLSIRFAGEAEQQAETSASMGQMFILALIVIYALLAVPLKSYLQPVIIMAAIPFGIVGAILGHWLNDLSLSILSLNGVLALSGVVVNDSLLLTSQYNQQTKNHDERHQALISACTGRLRPVLLTSATTFLGLMPLLYETSRQAQFLIPAAVSLAYGILFATVITLILIPALICIQEDVTGLLKRMHRNALNQEPSC